MKRSLSVPLLSTLLLFAAQFPRPAAAAGAGSPGPQYKEYASLFEAKCAKCHTVGGGDRVGPDLKGLQERRTKEWATGYLTRTAWYLDNDPEAMELLKRHNGVRMPDTEFTQARAEGMLNYLKEAGARAKPASLLAGEEEPVEETEPGIKTPEEGRGVWLPGIAAVFFILVFLLTVAAWAPPAGFRALYAVLLVLAAGTGYWSLGGRRYYRLLGDQHGYSPEQPIAFSHRLHAGSLGIDCLYCHYGAPRSDAAGVPPLRVCMNCHGVVRKTAGADKPSAEIAKLVAAWETRTSSAPAKVLWNRVHDLPDYARFTHRVHLADNIKCQECHGPVQGMVRVRQAASLSMGWCISCHRLRGGDAPAHWKRSGGPLDCAACHR